MFSFFSKFDQSFKNKRIWIVLCFFKIFSHMILYVFSHTIYIFICFWWRQSCFSTSYNMVITKILLLLLQWVLAFLLVNWLIKFMIHCYFTIDKYVLRMRVLNNLFHLKTLNPSTCFNFLEWKLVLTCSMSSYTVVSYIFSVIFCKKLINNRLYFWRWLWEKSFYF
jgi:hypothetical protein